MAPTSNAIATVTIQEQDLLTTTLPIIVQRSSASVTFPSANALQYGGFLNVLSAAFTNLFTGAVTPSVSFVYIRNASLSSNSVLFLQLTPTSQATVPISLFPGGIFLWANTTNSTANTFSQIAYAATVGAPVSMEYLYAF